MHEEYEEAVSIVKKLKDHGFVAYFAGGWVRDFLLNVPSDDIDIATNALPLDVKKLFKKTIPIGLNFGIILVVMPHKNYEVATFRQDIEYKDGRRPTKIVFTKAQEDAKRRDFTINGMFYDPIQKKIIDFVEGKKDLEKGIIRAIGTPHERFKEDRLRMIRAARISCRFDFTIEKHTKKAIQEHAKELFPSVAVERIWAEIQKIACYPKMGTFFLLLEELMLFSVCFPFLPKMNRSLLEEKTKYFDALERDTPAVAFLLLLMPKSSLEQKKQIVTFFKLSTEEKRFIETFHKAENLLQKPLSEISSYHLCYFFSSSYSSVIQNMLAIQKPLKEQKAFLQELEKRKKNLFPFIERIQQQKPVVNAAFLQKKGLTPGKHLGEILVACEKISMHHLLQDPEKVWDLLQEKKNL